MTISQLYPNIRPVVSENFPKTKKISPGLSYSRASIATYVDSDGLIKSAAVNEVRFDHNPTTRESLGLLVEVARTNLCSRSEEFDNGYFDTPTGSRVVPNTAIAPDGTFTADLLQEDTSTGAHGRLRWGIYTIGSGVYYTSSAFVKPAGRTTVTFEYRDGQHTVFNLQTLVVSGGGSGNAALVASSITPLPNGWYRLTATSLGVGGYNTGFGIGLHNGTSRSYTGDGVSGAFVWGLQVENASFPTSYIPTPATFTGRTSTATFYDANGIIQTAASGVARSNAFLPDSSGVFRPVGLLLEAAGTNLLTYSQEFDNVAWDKTQTTITANAVIAPDGATTADKLVPSTVDGRHIVYDGVTTSASTSYTFTCFAKAAEYSYLVLTGLDATNSAGHGFIFDLSTGTATSLTQSGSFTGVSASASKLPSGWYRCSITWTNGTTGAIVNQAVIGASPTSSPAVNISWRTSSYTGDGTSGIFVWGAQLEASSFATSYIPTVASTVTRSADTSTSSTVTRSADTLTIPLKDQDFSAAQFVFGQNNTSNSTTPVATFSSSLSSPSYSLQLSNPNGVPTLRQVVGSYSPVTVSLPRPATTQTIANVALNFNKTTGQTELISSVVDTSDAAVRQLPPTAAIPFTSSYFDTVTIGTNQTLKNIYFWRNTLTSNQLTSIAKEPGALNKSVFTTTGLQDELYENANITANGRPTLDLDFANQKNLVNKVTGQSLVTFTRASTGTYYDGSTTVKAEENLLANSNVPNGLGWVSVNGYPGIVGLELLSNGDFESGSTGWILGGGAIVSGGQLNFPNTGVGEAYRGFSWVPGGVYLITVDIETISGSGNGGLSFEATNSSGSWVFGIAGGPSGSLANNTVTTVLFNAPSNIGTQLRLISYNGAGDLVNGVSIKRISPDNVTAPNGTSTALTATATTTNATFLQPRTVIAGDHTFSVWLRRVTGTGNVDITCHDGGTWVTQTITSSWARYTVTQNLTVGTRNPGIRITTSGDQVEIWGAQLEQRSFVTAYTPTSSTPITNFIPQLLTAAVNTARFDHNPVTGESLGLLAEEARTNRFNNSLFGGSWNTFNGATTTFNAGIAPDGTNTAVLLTCNTSYESHLYYLINGTGNTVSVFAKKLTKTTLDIVDNSSNFYCQVNMNTWTVTSQINCTVSIVPYSNGWYRIVAANITNIGNYVKIGTYATSEPGTVLLWGVQLEVGSFPTSYIPTVASTVTRSADVASITGTNFSGFYRADEGTFFVSARQNSNDSNRPVLGLGTSTGGLAQGFGGSGGGRYASWWNGSIDLITSNSTTWSTGARIGASYTSTNRYLCLNAGTVASSATTLPNGGLIRIGASYNNTSTNIGTISRITYWPKRLPDTTLQTITATTPAKWILILDSSLPLNGICALITSGAVSYTVNWGDDTTPETVTVASGTSTKTHAYAHPKEYLVTIEVISGTFRPLYNNSVFASYIREIRATPTGWAGKFGTSLATAFYNSTRIRTIQTIDTSGITSFESAWRACSSIRSFPSITLSSATGTTSGTGFDNAWRSCTLLANFPASRFNTTTTTRFADAFTDCALTPESIQNILVSINTANTSTGVLGLSGGTNAPKSLWSSVANTAYDALIARGWTISFRA